MSRSRAYTFTINNPTEADLVALRTVDCKYIVYSDENGDTEGQPHYQCYIYFENAKSFSAFKKIFSRAHILESYGTAEQNRNYCLKIRPEDKGRYPEAIYEERGLLPMSQSDKGQAESDRWESYWEYAQSGQLEKIPAKERIRYYRTFDEIARNSLFKRSRVDTITVLRPWQQSLVASLAVDPDDRKVIWYVDAPGQCGKSKMARYLQKNHDALILHPAPYREMAYLLQPTSLVVIDVPRDFDMSIFPYTFLEHLKDNMVTSTKYQSLSKEMPLCHVVVMSNHRPKLSGLSLDRWDLRIIENGEVRSEVC